VLLLVGATPLYDCGPYVQGQAAISVLKLSSGLMSPRVTGSWLWLVDVASLLLLCAFFRVRNF
jgi:hypothetical protein